VPRVRRGARGLSVSATTNRILPTGATYDNHGNMNPALGTTLTFDTANRISQAQPEIGLAQENENV